MLILFIGSNRQRQVPPIDQPAKVQIVTEAFETRQIKQFRSFIKKPL